jgi:hypothetical protein
MNARTTFSAVAAVLTAALTTGAAASDFGISFSYSSHRPYYYTVTSPGYSTSRYYTTCTPRSYVYYGSYDTCDYRAPAVYLNPCTPSVVLYDDYYPTIYRRTYTRSRCYTPPVRHFRSSTYYRSGLGTRYYRRDCSPSRPRITLHRRSSGFGSILRNRSHRSYGHSSAYRDRSRSFHRRSGIHRDRSRGFFSRGSAFRDRGRSSHNRGGRPHARPSRSPRLRLHRR